VADVVEKSACDEGARNDSKSRHVLKEVHHGSSKEEEGSGKEKGHEESSEEEEVVSSLVRVLPAIY
jgi:hypothetical protein